MAKFQSVRGFNDVLPADAPAWRALHDTAARVFDAYGYAEIRLPLLERTELYVRSIGEATDVVEKEMFTFKDRENDSLTLRPEFTAGIVRAGVEHGLLHNQQQRLWAAGPVFRHERPQAGRYRQFHQLDVEAYGLPGPDIDIELIALSARLLRELGLMPAVTLQLNSLGTSESRAQYRAALIAHLRGREAQLDENSRRRLDLNPLRALDSKDPGTQAAVAGAPSLLDFLDADSKAHFEAVQAGLKALGVPFTVNPRIVRGLDYYSRTVFEWVTDRLGAQGTVLAGGRYDGLVSELGGGTVPAIGWAAGIERLLLLQKELQAQPRSPARGIYFCVLGERAMLEAQRRAESLRDAAPAAGIPIVVNAGGGKLPAQFKRAERAGAHLAVILGDTELDRGVVQVKSLAPAGEPHAAGQPPAQLEVPLTDLQAHLVARL